MNGLLMKTPGVDPAPVETEMKNTVDPFGKDAKNANFRLVDDRLIPFEFSCCGPVADLRSGYSKESAGLVADVAGPRVRMPLFEIVKRNELYLQPGS